MVRRRPTQLALALLCILPSLAQAYSETADVLIYGSDESYLGGPIALPDVHHTASTTHALPLNVQRSVTIPSSFTPGVTYTRASAITFANLPLPAVAAHSRYESHTLDAATATYATGALSYSFTVTGAPNAVVPLSLTSLFELSTNRPAMFANTAFADVGVALTVQDPLGTFAAMYGSSSSFISMRCSTNYVSADCFNRAGDDSLVKTVDGVVLQSTVQIYSFDAVGQNNLRSGQMAFAFGLPLNASGSASVSLRLSATSFASRGLFDTDATFVNAEQATAHIADAYIDPIILIDPAYLAAHPGTVLAIESGLGNGPALAVPELPTGALLLAGLAGLIWGVRHRSGNEKTFAWRAL